MRAAIIPCGTQVTWPWGMWAGAECDLRHYTHQTSGPCMCAEAHRGLRSRMRLRPEADTSARLGFAQRCSFHAHDQLCSVTPSGLRACGTTRLAVLLEQEVPSGCSRCRLLAQQSQSRYPLLSTSQLAPLRVNSRQLQPFEDGAANIANPHF